MFGGYLISGINILYFTEGLQVNELLLIPLSILIVQLPTMMKKLVDEISE